jgi:hypothetical protein
MTARRISRATRRKERKLGIATVYDLSATPFFLRGSGYVEWGEVFGDTIVATALLDRLLHHAIVVRIEGASYRLRRHADLLPDTAAARHIHQPEPAPRRRGRPPKARNPELAIPGEILDQLSRDLPAPREVPLRQAVANPSSNW